MTDSTCTHLHQINDLLVELNRAISDRDFDKMDSANDRVHDTIYAHLRDIGRHIAQVSEYVDGQGGDHQYDGALQHVWKGVHDHMGVPADSCMLIPLDGDCVTPREPKRTKKGYVRSDISSGTRLRIYKRDGYQCLHCGINDDLSIDHVHPVSEGGTNEDENLQTLCMPCNMKKGVTITDSYRIRDVS